MIRKLFRITVRELTVWYINANCMVDLHQNGDVHSYNVLFRFLLVSYARTEGVPHTV